MPNTLTGDGIVVQITNGAPPLANSGYFVFLPDNSSNTYTIVGIHNVTNSSGTYTYSRATNTAAGNLVLKDKIDGITNGVGLYFEGSDQGSFNLASISPSNYSEQGVFTVASGTAPTSMAGMRFYYSISDGIYPFADTSAFLLEFDPSKDTYNVLGGPGIFNSSGTYSYTVINRSTGVLQANDSLIGTDITYVSFIDSTSGWFATTQTSNGTNFGGYQVGTFTYTNTVPAFFSDEASLGDSWYYLAQSTNHVFGYYSTYDFPYIYHLDMGWEYFIDADNANGGAYFYDFTDGAFFYTEPGLFPYLYDFNKNAWLWYEPQPGTVGRYTSKPRYFFDFATQTWTNSL